MNQETFLKQYDASKYEKPSVTVDMAVFTLGQYESGDIRKVDERVLRILLIKRGAHPFKDCWALPGGFVKIDESLDEAAYRELKEETNVDSGYLEQLYTFGTVDRDPRLRVISCAYLSLIDAEHIQVRADSDAADAKWFDVTYRLLEEHKSIKSSDKGPVSGYILERIYLLRLSHGSIDLDVRVKEVIDVEGHRVHKDIVVLDEGMLAFDHGKIIAQGIIRLRNKVEYEDIAFHLMPEKFTLTDLQKVYECILDRELLKANFRRKIMPMVIETNEIVENQGFRPSQLFRFNTGWNLI